MKKLLWAFVLVLAVGCQKAELIESEKNEEGRGTEERNDTVDVDIEVSPEGWGGSIDVGFGFG